MSKKYNTIRFENAILNAHDDGIDILDYGDANMFRANIFKIQHILSELMEVFPLSTEVVAVWGHWHSKEKGWSSVNDPIDVVRVFEKFMDKYSPVSEEKEGDKKSNIILTEDIKKPKQKIIL